MSIVVVLTMVCVCMGIEAAPSTTASLLEKRSAHSEMTYTQGEGNRSGSSSSDDSGVTHIHTQTTLNKTTVTEAERNDEDPYTEAISQEKQLLKAQQEAREECRCRPVKQVLPLYTLVHSSVLSHYQNYLPDVLVVRRCLGFCGTLMGQSDGEDACQPERDGEKSMKVVIFEESGGRRSYKLLTVTEHTSCRCLQT